MKKTFMNSQNLSKNISIQSASTTVSKKELEYPRNVCSIEKEKTPKLL